MRKIKFKKLMYISLLIGGTLLFILFEIASNNLWTHFIVVVPYVIFVKMMMIDIKGLKDENNQQQ